MLTQLRAKAVFERDLRKSRAERAERERAAGILTKPAGVTKHQSPRIQAKKSPPATEKDTAEKDVAAQSAQPADRKPVDELTAVELPIPDAQASQDQLPMTGGSAIDPAPNVTSVMDPQNLDPTAGLAITLQPDSQASRKSSPKPEEKIEAAPISQLPNNGAEEQPPADHQEPAPFESMFNDLQNSSNPTSLDFDLSFPAAGSMPQELLNDPVFDTMGTSNDDQNLTLTLPSTTAEDIDSLLPGLERYVTNDGDFALIDMNLPTAAPEASALQNTSVPAPAAADTSAQQQQQSFDSAPIESNFDDLFGSGDWNIDDDLGGGTMDEFNDDWFKTDA